MYLITAKIHKNGMSPVFIKKHSKEAVTEAEIKKHYQKNAFAYKPYYNCAVSVQDFKCEEIS